MLYLTAFPHFCSSPRGLAKLVWGNCHFHILHWPKSLIETVNIEHWIVNCQDCDPVCLRVQVNGYNVIQPLIFFLNVHFCSVKQKKLVSSTNSNNHIKTSNASHFYALLYFNGHSPLCKDNETPLLFYTI